MATDVTLNFTTKADLGAIRQLVAEANNVRSAFGDALLPIPQEMAAVTKATKSLVPQLGLVAAGLLAIRAVGGFLKDSIQEALEAEKALKQLEAALAATGRATEANLVAFNDFAEEIQKTTRFNDDLVISQLAVAKNFGLTDQAAKQLINDAADLAAVTGKDLPEAVTVLLQALNGQGRALKILGPAFAQLTEEQLKSGAAQKLLQQNFGDRAEKDILTTAGALAQLGNTFNQLKETVGVFLVEVLKLPKAFSLASETIEAFSFFFKKFTGQESDLDKLNASIDETVKKIANVEASGFGNTDSLKKDLARKLEQLEGFNKSARAVAAEPIAFSFAVETEGLTKIINDLRKVGLTAVEIARQERDERKKALDEAVALESQAGTLSIDRQRAISDAKIRIEREYQDKVAKARKEASEKEAQELKRRQEIFKNAAANIGQSFVEIFNASKNGGTPSSDLVAGTALGVGRAVTQGAAGGRELLGAGVQLGGAALGVPPEVAAAVAPIIQELSKGKDAAKAFVTEFLNSIPDMIVGLVEGIEGAVAAFIENVPRIVEKFIAEVPRIITSLAESMPQVSIALALEMPAVAVTFATSLIEQAPAIAEAIVKAIGNAPGNAAKSVGGIFGFDSGGQGFVKSVPGGNGSGAGERFPAMLGSGELVVDRSTAYRLKSFLAGQEGSGSVSRPEQAQQGQTSMMEAMMALANRPVYVTIDGRVVAKAVRTQKRAGVVV